MKLIFVKTGLCLVAALSLSACQTSTPKVMISPEAEAALPPETDISKVRRLSNGCYFIVDDRGLTGFTQPLIGPDGTQVCDPVLFEQIMNPDRVVVNEKAV